METWRDIVAEMRTKERGEYFPFTEFEITTTPKIRHLLQVLADRIEKACKTLEDVLIVEQEENDRIKKELKAKKVHLEGLVNDVKNKNVRICKKQFETLSLERENAKLRRALEPVMKCDKGSLAWLLQCSCSVIEAQEIMKEGAK